MNLLYNINTNTRNGLGFVVLMLIVVISSNPFFYAILGKQEQIIIPAGLAFIFAIYRKIRVTRRDVVIFCLLLFVMSVHLFEYGIATIESSLAMMLKLFTALIIARTIPNYFAGYVSLMYVLSLLSLFFYVSPLVGLDLKGLFLSIAIPDEYGGLHIAIHNYKKQFGEDLYRNMGFFGEPGIFAGFLVLALLFMMKSAANVPRKYFYVLIIALVSSQSTTGYLAGLIVVPAAYIFRNRVSFANTQIVKMAAKGIIVVLFLIGFVSVFTKLPFLSEKIESQAGLIESQEVGWQLTRVGNAQFDMGYIADRPFFGWSQLLETRKLENEDFAFRQGNGLTGFAVRYGLVGIVVFFFFAFGVLTKYYGNKSLAAIAILVIGLILNGEHFLNFSLFLSLMFMPARATQFPNDYAVREISHSSIPRNVRTLS